MPCKGINSGAAFAATVSAEVQEVLSAEGNCLQCTLRCIVVDLNATVTGVQDQCRLLIQCMPMAVAVSLFGRHFVGRIPAADISLNCKKLTDSARRLDVDVALTCKVQMVDSSSRVCNSSSLYHIAVAFNGVVSSGRVGLQGSLETFHVSVRMFA